MKQQLVVNVASRESTVVQLTDEEIIARFKPQIEIAIVHLTKSVGESEPVSLQLMTPRLSDDTRNSVADNITITMQFGDVEQEVTLDSNGAWSDTLEFIEVGTYIVKCLSHYSNEITIEVT